MIKVNNSNTRCRNFFKIWLILSAVAVMISCDDDSASEPIINPDGGKTTDISSYILSYNSVTVAVGSSDEIDVPPTWNIAPTEVIYSNTSILPTGLEIDSNTGLISGTINTNSEDTITITITATGSGAYTGSVSSTFTLNVISPIPLSSVTFTYEHIYANVNENVSTSPDWNDNDYPVTATYAVNTSLPDGLVLDANTGKISGEPTAIQSTMNYTITATGNQLYTGTSTTTFNIEVAPEGSIFLNNLSVSYSDIGVDYDDDSYEVYTINISNTPNPTIDDVTPQWSDENGPVNPTNVSYAIEPAVPNWLNFDANTGIISNTETPTPYYRRHTLTATGNGGYVGSVTISPVIIAIAVNANNANLKTLINAQITDQGATANLNIIITSAITRMIETFIRKYTFNGDISRWDVSKVTYMSKVFNSATAFNGDISRWDVSKVTNMIEMFKGATSFNRNIPKWDVSKVTDMSRMFQGATSFNGDISDWDTSKVTEMVAMFSGATAFNGDISGWDTRNVIAMSGMFKETSFNRDISEWNVTNVKFFSFMFSKNTSFNQDISGWDVRSVKDMRNMFSGATAFAQDLEAWEDHLPIDETTGKIDLSSDRTENVFTDSGVTDPPSWYSQ